MGGQNPNMDQFEAYFKRADLDGDGRISGAEAVGFFQGSGLPKPVLFQVKEKKSSSWSDLGFFEMPLILLLPFELHTLLLDSE